MLAGVSSRGSVRQINFAPWVLLRLSFFSRLAGFRTRLPDRRIVSARRLFTANNRCVTRDACIALTGICFQRHLVKDSYLGSRAHWNRRSCRVARSAGNDTDIRLGNIERRHLRYVDMTGGAPKIMIVRFSLTVSGKTMSIVAELK